MRTPVVLTAGLAALVTCALPAAAAGPDAPAVLKQYCVTCHSERLKTGGLVLEGRTLQDVGSDIETWEKVVKKLRGGVMPPAKAPRPDPETYQGLIRSLETALDRHAAAAPNPGRPAVHRLNRAEYTNAIRDLLALEIDGKALLPGDDSGYGFDNVADALSVSPGLLERYLIVAKRISRLAVGDPTIRPTVVSYELPYLTLVQDERTSDGLALGSRGVAVRHQFPLDGEYSIKLQLQLGAFGLGSRPRGLDVRNQIDLRLDGERVKVFELSPREDVDGEDRNQRRGGDDIRLEVPLVVKAGTREIGVSLNRDQWYVEGVGMSRLPPGSDGYASGLKTERDFGRIDLEIGKIDVTGPMNGLVPHDSPSRRRIFICRPTSPAASSRQGPAAAKDEDACARRILSAIARRAYRRPLTSDDLETVLGFYHDGRREGTFDRGIQYGLVQILTDPDFLFRVEQDSPGGKPGTAFRVSDLELASRLSFFLWSSIPDDELLDVASQGRLKNSVVFEQQVRRMLADERAKALLNNFFGQWLLVRNMATVRPDAKAFPEFDENLRRGFMRETELFLDAQLREDRPITDILTANYTFLNERLARHYGVPNVYGDYFRRVTLSDGTRAGLLSHGSVLTVTSYPDRTSVVLRGKYILENILGTPPPPPPANVPPLENTKVEGSLRQRMEMHRKNPVCANCHAQLDPMGFAFENFNGVGRWRTEDGAARVDPSGALPDGTAFDGPSAFRQALMMHSDAFITTLTEKLLTYALGRGVEAYDMPTVRAIIRDTTARGNSWSALILNIARSLPFQMRRSAS